MPPYICCGIPLDIGIELPAVPPAAQPPLIGGVPCIIALPLS
jgi:hypothetical protein